MIYFLHQWRQHVKITLCLLAFLLIAITGTIIFIAPKFNHLQSLQQEKSLLENQLQQKHAISIRYQQLQRDITLLQYRYLSRLQTLRTRSAPSALYTKIALLAKSHALQLMALKPQQHQAIAGLERQVVEMDVNGAELNLLRFLQLLTHQPWLLDVQQIEMTPAQNGTALHTIMAIYYAAN